MAHCIKIIGGIVEDNIINLEPVPLNEAAVLVIGKTLVGLIGGGVGVRMITAALQLTVIGIIAQYLSTARPKLGQLPGGTAFGGAGETEGTLSVVHQAFNGDQGAVFVIGVVVFVLVDADLDGALRPFEEITNEALSLVREWRVKE